MKTFLRLIDGARDEVRERVIDLGMGLRMVHRQVSTETAPKPVLRKIAGGKLKKGA